MPAEPYEIRVLEAVKGVLEGVTQGAYHNTVDEVFLEEDLPFEAMMKGSTPTNGARIQVVALSTDEDVTRYAGRQAVDMGLRLVCGQHRDRNPGAEIQKDRWRLLADVARALLSNYDLGGLVFNLEVVQKIPFADGSESDHIGGLVLAFVSFRHSALDPYLPE